MDPTIDNLHKLLEKYIQKIVPTKKWRSFLSTPFQDALTMIFFR